MKASAIYQIYYAIIINLPGFILNFIKVIILIKRDFHTNSCSIMFKYFLFKSVFDTVYSFFIFCFSIIALENTLLNDSWIQRVILFILQDFLCSIAVFSSILFEIMAALSKLVTISRRFLFFNRISYKIITFSVFFFTNICYVHRIFLIEAKLENKAEFSDEYSNNFGEYKFFYAFDLVMSFLRDILCVVFLFILNVLVMVWFKKSLNRKKILFINLKSPLYRRKLVKTDKAEIKNTIIVILSSLLTIIGHTPSAVKFFITLVQDNNSYFDYVRLVSRVSMDLYFSLNIFLFLFNKIFRRAILKKLLFIFKIFKCFNFNKTI